MSGSVAAALVVLFMSGCGGSQGGDTVPRPDASVTGTGYTLSQLNTANPPPNPNKDLEVTGVSVLAVDSYDETNNGKSAGDIYVEDVVDPKSKNSLASGYHGIEVFSPSFNPPDLRVASGDVVDIRGRYQLFTGPSTFPFPAGQVLPELVGGAISLRFEYSVPNPVKINLKDLVDYKTGKKWMGMLVEVDNVSLFADGALAGSGRYAAQLAAGNGVSIGQLPTLTNALFPLETSKLPLTKGTTYKSIVGIVQYFSNFSIAPRSARDLTPS